MRLTYPNRSVVSIFLFILLATLLLQPPGTAFAGDLEQHKPGSQLAPRKIKPNDPPATFSSITFEVPLKLINVQIAQVGMDLLVYCFAFYGNNEKIQVAGKTVKPYLLNSSSYQGTINVPMTKFLGKPSGKKPYLAACMAFAKRGNQCSGLSGINYPNGERVPLTQVIVDCDLFNNTLSLGQ